MKHALVTGGAGFIGSHIVDALIEKGYRVTVLDDLSTGERDFVHPRAHFVKGRIQDARLYKKLTKRPVHYIFHLAAHKSLQASRHNLPESLDTNVMGTVQLIHHFQKHRSLKRFLFFSTAAVYDIDRPPPFKETSLVRPVTPYGIGKMASEKLLAVSGLPFTILRLSNVYGPRQDSSGEGGVVGIFSEALVFGRHVHINNTGRQTRDFIHVKDVVRASLRSMVKARRETLNISTNQELSINKLYSILAQHKGVTRKPKRDKKVREQFRSRLDNRKAQRLLGWEPQISIKSGLAGTLDWYINQYEAKS